MKNTKRIVIALVLAVVILCLGAFAILANDQFPGTIYRLGIYVKNLDKATTIFELDTMLLEVDEYLFNYPVDPESEGYEELAIQLKNKKIAITNDAVAEVAAQDDPMQKSRYLKIASYWFANTPYTDEEMAGDDYLAIKGLIDNTAITVATSLYDDIDASKFVSGAAKEDQAAIAIEGIKLKRLRTFITSNRFDETNQDYQKMYADYASMWALYQSLMDERFYDLAKDAPLTEYGLGNSLYYHFENNQTGCSVANASKTSTTGEDRSVKNVTETETYLDENGNEVTNAYKTLRWHAAGDTNVNAYWNITFSGGSNGCVMEFDFTTMGQMINASINFGDRRTTTDINTFGGPTTATYFYIKGDGGLYYTDDAGAEVKLFDDMTVAGQWTRLSFVINPKTPKEGHLYIDYCYIATINTKLTGSNPSNIRIGNVNNKSGEFSMDNYKVQLGTWFRDENLITNMQSDIERALFYTEYMGGVEKATPDRILAYNNAKALLVSYASYDEPSDSFTPLGAYETDASVLKAVEAYNNFDPTAIVAEYKEYNLNRLVDLKAALDNIPRGPEKVATRSAALADVNNFINNNGAYIKEGDVYNAILAEIGDVQFEIDMDNAILSFNTIMTAFNSTTSVSLLNKKYDQATEALIPIDVTLADDEGYETFKAAYDSYLAAADKISGAVLAKNSRDIIMYVNFLSEKYPNEYDWKLELIEKDNLTDAEIENNNTYVFISDYVAKIRKLVNSGYDVKVGGVDSAIQRFNALNEYYYNINQNEIAEEYSYYLDMFAATESYIEKQGIIAYLERYKMSKEIDYNHAAIQPLETRFQAYKAELDYQVDGYEYLLNQNSVYFVNTVKLFDTVRTYSEKKALFDVATLYYFQMNAGSTEAAEASAKYAEMSRELAVIESASVEFVKALELRKLTDGADAKYAYLVDAVANYQYVDSSIEGVAEAIAEYNAVLSEYNAQVEAANKDILQTGVALGSLRANCGLSAIISVVIEALFNF